MKNSPSVPGDFHHILAHCFLLYHGKTKDSSFLYLPLFPVRILNPTRGHGEGRKSQIEVLMNYSTPDY